MPTLFISRELRADSPLPAWCEAQGVDLIARSFLQFAPLPFDAPEEADWWFFYSPRAVEFSYEQLPNERPKLAAMGEGTARALVTLGFTADFVGKGDPEAVARAFAVVSEGQRVFFPRAKQSRRSVQRLLAAEIEVLDAVCYDNRAVPVRERIEADTYVFTSPLNVAAYVDHQPLATGSRVIAFGPSTGQALEQRGIKHLTLTTPSETALMQHLM